MKMNAADLNQMVRLAAELAEVEVAATNIDPEELRNHIADAAGNIFRCSPSDRAFLAHVLDRQKLILFFRVELAKLDASAPQAPEMSVLQRRLMESVGL